ncbi:hypothetical protein QQ045_001969 [Rhodiola kirilowii]
MSRVKDRTEDFKYAVRQEAISIGYDESKLASILASFIIHKPRERLPFTKAASKTAAAFIKTCKKQIDILNSRIINNEGVSSNGWLGLASGETTMLILGLTNKEWLHSVSSQFDRLRARRFQDVINKALPRRKLAKLYKPADASGSNNCDSTEPERNQPDMGRVQQQYLDDETRALQVELSTLLDAVQDTETKMVEMSALNHLMSTHILQQAQQIEVLYEQAVEATKNVELGNKELSQAIQRNSSSRTFLLMFLFVLTFSVLFLDWYS